MMKLSILLASLAILNVASGALVGGYQPAAVNDQFLDVARWATARLQPFTHIRGDHTLLRTRNLETQVVAGINYRFDADVLIQDEAKNLFGQSCKVTVFDQPWSNTREILGTPDCQENNLLVSGIVNPNLIPNH